MENNLNLREIIREIPDFPKPGISFKDITPLLLNPKKMEQVIEVFANYTKDKNINKIACIESRGFIFGAILAYKLGLGLVPIRKKGKLPFKTIQASYGTEYSQDFIEIHQDALDKNDNVLILDDLLATGGTAQAAKKLVEQLNANVVSFAFVIELTGLNGKDLLEGVPYISLLEYEF